MPFVTQTRTLPGSTAYRSASWRVNGVKQITGPVDNDIAGGQTTSSWRTKKYGQPDYVDYQGLSGPDLRRRLYSEYQTRFDNGHEFSTSNNQFTYPYSEDCMVSKTVGSTVTTYRGPLRPDAGFDWPIYPTLTAPSQGTITLKGSQFISRTAPTASEAALAQFLGELLQDGLPKIPGLRAFRERSLAAAHKHAGNTFLEQQFDVKPFIGDLRSMAQAVLTAGKRIKQLNRDSDRVVRRRAHFDEDVQTVDRGQESLGASFLGLPRMNNSSPPAMFTTVPPTRAVDIVNQRWSFASAYTYHLADATSAFGQFDRYMEEANRLLGSEITLETIWQLTRWSWLVDWFVNVGSFLHNVSLMHNDSLVLRYGYVMCHTTVTRQRTIEGIVPIGTCSHSVLTSYARRETKTRTRATPYGFGLSESSFSDTQWAILGALGLSKSPKTLRHNE